jgi:flagellar biosynthesis protein FlhG
MSQQRRNPGKLDQASQLRAMMHKQHRSAMVLAVVSGKGGVGKSNVAVNLSICLAANSLRVTLVDVDMGLANADLLMNIQPRYTLSHVLSGQKTIDEISEVGQGGVRFIAGASGIHELANLANFERQNLILQLQKLENNTDIVVLDCGAGLSHNVLSFALAADRVTVVTTPQPTAMTDAYATIKTLHQQQCCAPLCLFVNMALSKSEAGATYRRLSSVAQRFLNYSVADDGYMLHDRSVELAVRERCPFVTRFPNSNASACIAAMAGQLAKSIKGQDTRGGFFKRVVGLFV